MGDVFNAGDNIFLICRGTILNPDHILLEGNPTNKTVTLTGPADHDGSGLWEVVGLGGDKFAFAAIGVGPGDSVFLDGRTIDGSVGLAPSTDPPFTGTHWEAILHRNPLGAADGTYRFKCLGHISNPDHVFLDGRTIDGSVGLAPSAAPPFTGTHWEAFIFVLPPGFGKC